MRRYIGIEVVRVRRRNGEAVDRADDLVLDTYPEIGHGVGLVVIQAGIEETADMVLDTGVPTVGLGREYGQVVPLVARAAPFAIDQVTAFPANHILGEGVARVGGPDPGDVPALTADAGLVIDLDAPRRRNVRPQYAMGPGRAHRLPVHGKNRTVLSRLQGEGHLVGNAT